MSDEQEAPVAAESVFTDHLVLYMDFLGVSEAAMSWPEDRAAKLIELLTTIAAEKTEFSIDGASQADGSYKFKITPETATFSDNIVASYRLRWQEDERLQRDDRRDVSEGRAGFAHLHGATGTRPRHARTRRRDHR